MADITGAREAVLYKTADTLLNARRTGIAIADLPADLQPGDENEAFFVQDIMARAFGEIGGWKIGARGADAEPFFAPMPAAWIGQNGSTFAGPMYRLNGVECEIAFRMGHNLLPRSIPYTRDEVIEAIASCHPAIEIIESAFADTTTVPRLASFADMQIHGGFVAGPAVADWQQINWANEKVTLVLDASVRLEKVGSNPGGNDLLRLLVYLANEGSVRTGGLRAGQYVTTGSWTGVTWASNDSAVMAEFEHAGSVAVEFAKVHLPG